MQPLENTRHFPPPRTVWLAFSNVVLPTNRFVLGNFVLVQEEM
jgi:hypothetical protein